MATFCLLHGAWHDPSCWESLARCLLDRGHEVVAPDLPFHDPDAGWEARVRPALEATADVDGTLVVVGHSLASGYAPLVTGARPGALLVHLCPRLGPFPSPSGAPATFREGGPSPTRQPDGTTAWDTDAAVGAMYGRLDPEDARARARRLRPLADVPDAYPLPGHPEVPTALIYAADDEFFAPDWERFMARELLGIEPIEIAGGHFPMLEDPNGLAEVLARLAADHARGADGTSARGPAPR